jgi:hypothetical protein
MTSDIARFSYNEECERITVPEYRTKMLLLSDMGYRDFTKNFETLRKYNWQVELAIFDL